MPPSSFGLFDKGDTVFINHRAADKPRSRLAVSWSALLGRAVQEQDFSCTPQAQSSTTGSPIRTVPGAATTA
jgi:hypothetical protein